MRDELRDKKGRRRPHAPPLPTLDKQTGKPKPIAIRESDVRVFMAHNDFGPLPTHYQYEFAKDLRADYKGHQKRMGLLRNNRSVAYDEKGREVEGYYLYQPDEQTRTSKAQARKQSVVRDNAELARLELQKRDYWLYPPRFDHMLHRMMNGCVVASIYLSASKEGFRYVTLREIVTRHTCPKATRDSDKPLLLETSRGTIIPDELGGLGYPTEPMKFRFLAFEQDRGTEQSNDIEQKFACYLEVLRRKLYQDKWGITNLYVCFTFTKPQRMRNMMSILEKMTRKEPELREFFLFKVKPIFSGEWQTPPIMYDQLADPWERAGLQPFYLDKA
jgi:hypothetical protein